jgi:hypothetical protein
MAQYLNTVTAKTAFYLRYIISESFMTRFVILGRAQSAENRCVGYLQWTSLWCAPNCKQQHGLSLTYTPHTYVTFRNLALPRSQVTASKTGLRNFILRLISVGPVENSTIILPISYISFRIINFPRLHLYSSPVLLAIEWCVGVDDLLHLPLTRLNSHSKTVCLIQNITLYKNSHHTLWQNADLSFLTYCKTCVHAECRRSSIRCYGNLKLDNFEAFILHYITLTHTNTHTHTHTHTHTNKRVYIYNLCP